MNDPNPRQTQPGLHAHPIASVLPSADRTHSPHLVALKFPKQSGPWT